jgi:cell division septation protein DedD
MANHGPSESAPSAKQLVFLAMMATVVAVIVFLCGVLVGRGMPSRAAGTMATGAALSGAGVGFGVPEIAPDPEAAQGSPLDALSYFDRLSRTDAAPETPFAPAGELAPELGAAPSSPGPPSAAGVPLAAGSFVVQVTALRSGDAARTVAAELVAKGYPAVVVDPAPGAPRAVYRVRVGPYADKSEADTVRDRLETEEPFTPFVIRP